MVDQPDRESLEYFLLTILYIDSIIDSLPTPPPLYCLVGALALGAWGEFVPPKTSIFSWWRMSHSAHGWWLQSELDYLLISAKP